MRELVNCARDPIYFINNYCKIQHPHRGLIDFSLWKYQEDAIKAFLAHDRTVINKARQLGFSTLTAAYITWLTIFHNDKLVMIVSIKADVAKNMLRKIKKILTHLPEWMYLVDIIKNQEHFLEFSNGSWIKSIARTDDAGRSEGLSLLVIDEAAIIRGMDELWKSLKSTVSTGGKIIALSTPFGVGGWFYNIYKKAKSKENDWYPMEIPWWECPDYATDLKDDPKYPGGKVSSWFKAAISDMTREQVYQELLTSFIGSGNTYIDNRLIEYYEKLTREPTEERLDGDLWIWELPRTGGRYIIGADTASGAGADYCAAQVIDLLTLDQVAEYKGKISPDIFAEILYEMSREYNNAIIVCENNTYGMHTVINLETLHHDANLGYFDPKNYSLIDKWDAIVKDHKPGINMHGGIRPAVLSKTKQFIEKKQIRIKSARLVDELLTFEVINGKPQAKKGYNDDLLISLSLCMWVRDVSPDFGETKWDGSNIDLINSIVVERTNYDDFVKTHEQKQQELKVREKFEEYRKANLPKFIFTF